MDSFRFLTSAETRTDAGYATLDVAKTDYGANKYDSDIPQDFHETPPLGGIDDWGC